MKPFDVNRFMRNVCREAGYLELTAESDWSDIVFLFQLKGEAFVRSAYRFVLHREADLVGLSQYVVRAETIPGKLCILLSLYSSPEYRHISLYMLGKLIRGLVPLFSAQSLRRFYPSKRSSLFQNTDALYLAFENRFREDFDTILKRLDMRYSAVLKDVQAEGQRAALDLGCGRGEAVALFRTYGFQATGVDGNRAAVQEAAFHGLGVVHGDIFKYIKLLPSDSQCVVSAFHVVEHLPFERLLELVDEAWRVLKPGGLLLLETPNARNLLVTGGDFYRDPTHLRPIFPDTLDFILNGAGFAGQAFFFKENGQLLPAAEARLDEIQDYFYISRDMAWIGHKTMDRRGW